MNIYIYIYFYENAGLAYNRSFFCHGVHTLEGYPHQPRKGYSNSTVLGARNLDIVTYLIFDDHVVPLLHCTPTSGKIYNLLDRTETAILYEVLLKQFLWLFMTVVANIKTEFLGSGDILKVFEFFHSKYVSIVTLI